MAHEISGNRGASGQPQIGTSQNRGPSPTSGVSPTSKINETDDVNFTDEADAENGSQPVNQAGASTPANGVGISSGGVFSPTSGSAGFGPPGVHSGGVLVSGQSPGLNMVPGSAGKVFS